jgi:hypothetical protein
MPFLMQLVMQLVLRLLLIGPGKQCLLVNLLTSSEQDCVRLDTPSEHVLIMQLKIILVVEVLGFPGALSRQLPVSHARH